MQKVTSAEKLPWPGEELVNRVTGAFDRENFYASGQQSVRDIESVLALVGRSLDSFGTVLDFGSGCGRIMLWLQHLSETCDLHGVDIDARAIGWAQDNMPWATFKVNQPLPPLDYADATFDLVFNHSVFTHIDEEYQDQWLAELQRVVKPDGLVLLTVHGEHAFMVFEENVMKGGGDPSVIRAELGRKGISFIHDDAFTGGPFPDFYHSTFHAPWYVWEHWGRYFEIAAYVVRGSMGFQDFVLLRRRPEERPLAGKGSPISVAKTSAGATAAALDGPPVAGTSKPPGQETALERAGRLLHEGFDVRGSSAPERGLASRLAGALVQRVVGRHASYQRQINEATFTGVWEMNSELVARTTWNGVPLTELNARLWDAVRLQGQRINRLEADLWEALASQRKDASQSER
jgi:SAM-dependent methyltransferase